MQETSILSIELQEHQMLSADGNGCRQPMHIVLITSWRLPEQPPSYRCDGQSSKPRAKR